MMEKAKNMNYAEFRIQTYAEACDRIMLTCAVYGIPENEHKYQKMPFLYEPKHGIDLAKRFDAEMAEMIDDRNAEKARVRNRRHADRKYKLTPKMRKEQEYMRNWNVCMKMVNFGTWDDIPIVEGRVRSAEQIAREDYEIELCNIAEDAERDAIDAEVREWELKHAVEQANARAWMAMQNWLEWA